MQRIIYIVTLLFCNLVFGNNINNLSDWQNILFFSSDNKKEVLDTSFYLSDDNNLGSEIDLFKIAIKSNQGKEWACNYPARYNLLKETIHNTPLFNLKKCNELSEFKNSFEKKYVSLIMTSELLDTPASAFGHLMIVLHDDVIPSESSDIIHFSAEASRERGFIDYAKSGLSGKYAGYYWRGKFFEKISEYSKKEQRYMFGYHLKMSEVQKDTLLNLLFEMRKVKFKYYFLNENCGYRLGNLLENVYKLPRKNNVLYSLPIEVTTRFKAFFQNRYVIKPSSIKGKDLKDLLSPNDIERLESILSAQTVLSTRDSKELRLFIFKYFNYQFESNKTILPNYKENLKASLIQDSSGPKSISGEVLNPVDKQYHRSLALGGASFNGEASQILSFRPVLQSIYMNQSQASSESELSLLDFEFLQRGDKMLVNYAKLISVKGFAPTESFYPTKSWQFEVAINRENYLHESALDFKLGIGKTISIAANVGLLLNIGNETLRAQNKMYASPEFYLFYYPFDAFKLMLSAEYKIYERDNIMNTDSSLSYLISQSYEVFLKYRRIDDKYKLSSLELSYYF